MSSFFILQKIRCKRKEPCRLFSVKESSIENEKQSPEVNISTLCECPRKKSCPAHHSDVGSIPGAAFSHSLTAESSSNKDSYRTYTGYCAWKRFTACFGTLRKGPMEAGLTRPLPKAKAQNSQNNFGAAFMYPLKLSQGIKTDDSCVRRITGKHIKSLGCLNIRTPQYGLIQTQLNILERHIKYEGW